MAPELVLVQGLRDTRGTLERWNARPFATLGPWLAVATAVCSGLLVAVVVVARFSTPDPTGIVLPGLNAPATVGAVGHVLFRNSLVLALHAMACVAGFIAGSSLPLEAERYSGVWRWVHDKAGPLAIAFVIAATTFSLFTQAYTLGHAASTLAAQGNMPSALLVVGILPHALPELIGLFLPLAAWMSASRRGAWEELLAATFATVAIAIPLIVTAAFIEVYVSPHLILALRG
ncbi:MAG TPA: stage II sporulation protein M [Baekduia sp.]|nr:stage II sporulation protein M [Baekduia sp.]